MKILHISFVRKLTHGQRMQLKAEVDAANNIDDIEWKTLAYHTGTLEYDFERKIPVLLSGVILRKLFAWIVLLKLAKQYDVVMIRKISFDPFSFLTGWFMSNRYTVHHSKEIAELKLINTGIYGLFSSWLEKFSGKIDSLQIRGYIAVTKEIAHYENIINNTVLPEFFYPNGIDVNKIKTLDDKRNTDINAAFICGTFTAWHGLDLLLEALKKDYNLAIREKLKIHLIGKLDEKQLAEIKQIDSAGKVLHIYGHLELNEYKDILSKCNFGIGSLAMFRQNLAEGATLKVREYLASGLPVYSGHKDTALDDDFQFYLFDTDINIKNMIDFGEKMCSFSRESVRISAIPFINKENIMKIFLNKLILHEKNRLLKQNKEY